MKVSCQSDLGTGNIWTYRADCIGTKVKANRLDWKKKIHECTPCSTGTNLFGEKIKHQCVRYRPMHLIMSEVVDNLYPNDHMLPAPACKKRAH